VNVWKRAASEEALSLSFSGPALFLQRVGLIKSQSACLSDSLAQCLPFPVNASNKKARARMRREAQGAGQINKSRERENSNHGTTEQG
jgi:hypothetical protein